MTILLTMITPKGKPVIADGAQKIIQFPDLRKWRLVDAKIARASGTERIAPPDFEQRIDQFLTGQTVNLAGEGQLRLGCSFGLLINDQPAFGQFDAGHPTRANQLTPPAGLFLGGEPKSAAIQELSEEFIVRSDTKVGVWQVDHTPAYLRRAEEYAHTHQLEFDPLCQFRVQTLSTPLHFRVRFGTHEEEVLIAFEVDSSGVELIWTGAATLPHGWFVVDGEKLPDGSWRETPIITHNFDQFELTTKAKILLQANMAGLAPLEVETSTV